MHFEIVVLDVTSLFFCIYIAVSTYPTVYKFDVFVSIFVPVLVYVPVSMLHRLTTFFT